MLSDGPAPDRPESLSPFLLVFGWGSLLLGLCAPLRIGMVLGNVTSNLYVSNPLIYVPYDIVLSTLVATTGWGLLRRRSWAPLLTSISAGVMVALGSGSLVVLRMKYFGWAAPGRGPHDRWQFCADHWAFILMNATFVVVWGAALGRLIQLPARKVFVPSTAGAAGLLGIALLSFGSSLFLTGLVWFYFVLDAAPMRW